MKSFKGHILDKDNTNLENTVEIEESKINSKPNDPPAIMVMRRKSIRQFPNGQRVALYFIDKIHVDLSTVSSLPPVDGSYQED